jgi:hypothetical protein
MKISLLVLSIYAAVPIVEAFQISSQRANSNVLLTRSYHQQQRPLHMAESEDNRNPLMQPNLTTDEDVDDESATGAATNTINERLMTELQEASDKEKSGKRSGMTKKMGLMGRIEKTPEEQQAAIDAARNLNGVNPAVALAGGAFGLAMAGGLWFVTLSLAGFFTLNPVETDVYFVQRSAAVIRNIVMGLSSLASGFFGVTGLGIFALGVKVAIGVAKGELDPTPLKKKPGEEIELPDVWALMMNKKPSRRNGSNDDNPFGI